eukprot:7310612-Pyramimonas_sp.AAC.1
MEIGHANDEDIGGWGTGEIDAITNCRHLQNRETSTIRCGAVLLRWKTRSPHPAAGANRAAPPLSSGPKQKSLQQARL